ncbi:unnamed protein product [Dicrocoelium dendriticum]|nr:unnamed protein product [Dicrocoelium dendriticum]
MNGKSFEFRVTFHKSRIKWWGGRKSNATVICQKLKEISGLIETCIEVTMHGDYGFADVLLVPTNTTLWEAQLLLMTQLNSKIKVRCNFNVAVKPIIKAY